MAAYRNFCFTYFPKDNDTEWRPNINNVSYITFQFEKCPQSGRIHAQGYCELKKKMRIRALKLDIFRDNTVHVERRMGNQKQAVDYCHKEDSRFCEGWTYGELKKQGERTDIKEMMRQASNPEIKMADVVENNPVEFAKYHRGAEKARYYADLKRCNKWRNVVVTILWGDTGSGKTSRVFQDQGVENVFVVNIEENGHIWWDGYQNQDTILFDEFYCQVKLDRMLRLLDGYFMQLPVKGGFCVSNWTNVYITTNKDPDSFYEKAFIANPKTQAAFFRRITNIIKV